MLLRLMIVRLCPFAALCFCRERKQMKRAVMMLMILYAIGFLIATGKIVTEEKWLSLLYVPLSMFPHYICYGIAAWMLARCIWYAWSMRVWKRIRSLAVISVLAGIFAENYWNPKILQFFFEIFK